MRIRKGIEIVENYPAIFIEPMDALVIADLHLGFERELVDSGIFYPHFQYQDIKESITSIVNRVSPRQVIVNGDLKHKFAERTTQELNEVLDLLTYLTEITERVIVIRGNHDNFVKGLFKRFPKAEFIQETYVNSEVLFTHGHVVPSGIDSLKSNLMIIAHEHPAIALRDDVGAKVKLRALLIGPTYSKKELIVLPAFSPISLGVEINLVTSEDQVISPFLREQASLMKMKAYGIDAKSGIFSFPELRFWCGTEPKKKAS
nr:metallophosphoesterase [Candidatus Njordarchaeum guaymaensis]